MIRSWKQVLGIGRDILMISTILFVYCVLTSLTVYGYNLKNCIYREICSQARTHVMTLFCVVFISFEGEKRFLCMLCTAISVEKSIEKNRGVIYRAYFSPIQQQIHRIDSRYITDKHEAAIQQKIISVTSTCLKDTHSSVFLLHSFSSRFQFFHIYRIQMLITGSM